MPKRDRKNNNVGHEIGKQVLVSEVHRQKGRPRIEEGENEKRVGKKNLSSISETNVSDLVYISISAHKEIEGYKEGSVEGKKRELVIAKESVQELDGWLASSMGGQM